LLCLLVLDTLGGLMATTLAVLLWSLPAAQSRAIAIASETHLLQHADQDRESNLGTAVEAQAAHGLMQRAAGAGPEHPKPGCYLRILETSGCANQELATKYRDWALEMDPGATDVRASIRDCMTAGTTLDLKCGLRSGTVQTSFKSGSGQVEIAAAAEKAKKEKVAAEAKKVADARAKADEAVQAEAELKRQEGEPEKALVQARTQAEETTRAEAEARRQAELSAFQKAVAEAKVVLKARREAEAKDTARAKDPFF